MDFTFARDENRELASPKAWEGYRTPICTISLMLSDAVQFLIAALTFRHHQAVPTIYLAGSRPTLVGAVSIDIFVLLAVAFVGIRYFLGDYSRRQLFWDSARSTTVSLIIAAIPSLIFVAAYRSHASPFAEFGSWIYLIVAIPISRQAVRLLLAKGGLWYLPTLLIGSGDHARTTYLALKRSIALGYDVRWIAPDDVERETPPELSGLIKIYAPNADELRQRLASLNCAQAIIAVDDMQSPDLSRMFQRLLEANLNIAIVPSFQRLPIAVLNASYFLGRNILLWQVRNNLQRLPQRFEKRLMDIVGAATLLVLLSPLFVVIALLIKRYDGGRVTYAQKRIGQNGEPFKCLKFRTMEMNADERLQHWRDHNPKLYEEYAKTFKLRDDPRITAPGVWLRKTSLDELPQLVNVLRGEMSLVGPRPVVEQELREHYGPAAGLYMRVRPGMTGLWQVSGRSDTSYEERVVFDEWYILNWSFWYDIVILFQTAGIVFSGRGAY